MHILSQNRRQRKSKQEKHKIRNEEKGNYERRRKRKTIVEKKTKESWTKKSKVEERKKIGCHRKGRGDKERCEGVIFFPLFLLPFLPLSLLSLHFLGGDGVVVVVMKCVIMMDDPRSTFWLMKPSIRHECCPSHIS